MRFGLIYKVTSPSGKVYIGQTVKTLSKRKSDHFSYVKQNPKIVTKWTSAIKKYGNQLVWSVMYDHVPIKYINVI